MWTFVRFLRASWLFARVLLSYGWQFLLCKIVPPWGRRRWHKVHTRNAKRLRRGFTRLRGVYIKLGQVLSVLGSFLPPAFVRELEALQDAVPPRRFRQIDKAIRRELGGHAQQVFADFSQEPIAAASLAQVHRAQTKDGQAVAVKVLYPNIRKIIKTDLRVLAWVNRAYKLLVPMKHMDRVQDQLEDLLQRETDLDHEALCLTKMAELYQSDKRFAVPLPVESLCAKGVLTMSYETGTKITDKKFIAEKALDPHTVATTLVEGFCRQLFEFRFLHADPHPGNLFIRVSDDNELQIVLLDLGSATDIPANLISGMKLAVQGIFMRNDDLLFEGIKEMGFVGPDPETLKDKVSRYFKALLGLKIDKPSELGAGVKQSLEREGLGRKDFRELMSAIEYPDAWFYCERAIAMILGVIMQIDPSVDMFSVAGRFLFSNDNAAKATA